MERRTEEWKVKEERKARWKREKQMRGILPSVFPCGVCVQTTHYI
jgi:hypothetical protein